MPQTQFYILLQRKLENLFFQLNGFSKG